MCLNNIFQAHFRLYYLKFYVLLCFLAAIANIGVGL